MQVPLTPWIVAAILLSPSPGAAGTTPPPRPPEAAAPASQPVFGSLEGGIAEARRRGGNRILVFLEGRDCGQCERMNALILPSRAYREYVEDKVVVRLKIESPDGAQVASEFGIKSPPAWVVLTPDGMVCWLQAGTTSQAHWFEALQKGEKQWAFYQSALAEEAKNPRDGQLIFDNARETFKRHGDVIAEQKFKKLVDNPLTPAPIREQSLAYLATIEMDSKRLDDAGRHLELLLKTGKDPVLRERAEFRLAEVEIGKKNYAEARRRFDAFRKAHPTSKLLPELEALRKLIDSIPAESVAKDKKR